MAELLSIEVVYALPERQRLLVVRVPEGTTVREAVALSGIGDEFPDLDTAACPLGIFGAQVPDEHVLAGGDRVEIYRPLINDPRETRRRLAASGRTMGKVGLEDN